MINGIPVLASNRGALPEVVGGVGRSHGSGIRGQGSEVRPEGGFLFEIPARYTPETTLVPTAEEVEPWVETIIRLWDDEALFRKCSDNARTHALQWHPDRVGPIYAEFFRTLPLSPEERGVNQVTPLSREGRGVQSELTSIVIVTLNQLDHTKLCIESIQRHTTEPYELVFVDNGSSDDTVGYLRSIPNAKLIVNAANRGFPAAANQGLQAGSGRQSLLLNNDTIVTPGWLTRLLRALYSDPTVGMVGPCSNFVSGPQQIPVPYHDLDEIHRFARDWGEANEGRRIETDRLVGFCLLIRREVVERIGLLDERYGIGNFEDDDYCLRARQAGYRLVITRDAFVHHFGGATFIGSRVDHGTLMRRNQRLFQQKWRAARGQRSEVRGQYPTDECRMTNDETPTDHGPLTTDQVLLSLCMIARDNERTIGAALEGIRPWVDEMVVVDTGSNDATPQIAESLGARAFHFSWCDDFSAARNESIRHAGGRWIFWMDTDDTIDAENGRKLRELVSRQWSVVSGQLEKTLPTREPTDNGQRTTGDPPVLGYLMKVRCPATQANGEVDFIEVDQVKLFRNLPALRFEGRIHEQILMAIRRAGGTVAWTDIFVVHSGAEQSPEGRARKIERDLRILQLDYKERPDHPFVLFNLGMTYAEAGRHEEAIGFLWQSIGRSGSDDSHLRKAYALLVSCYRNLGRHVTAWETCQQGLGRFPEDAELRFRQATLLHQFGRLPEAAQAYESLLHAPQGRHLSSVDWGIKGYRARQNLAVVYADLGDLAKAEEQWHRVVDEVPNYHPGWQGLGETLLRQRKVDEALAVADHLTPSSVVQLGYVLWECGRRAEAIAAWQQALRVAPGDPGATQAIRQAKQTADA
ncbi:MAG: glycosyltransferase [Planctomycetes bacterium]|nr:glycosyltransferase [Planctomycetota bacterium]